MNNYMITFYGQDTLALFRITIPNCSQQWAIDEAEEMLRINPEAKTYNINLAL